jgi:WXG100 family type VII secretion target
MNNGSKLNYAEMMSLSSEMLSLSRQMEQLLEEVKAEFNRVGSAEVWSGDAAEQVRAKFDEMSMKFPPFVEAIDACSKRIKEVVANFEETDKMLNQQIN